MNGFLLLIPFLFIRFGVLSLLNKNSLNRAAFFAPVVGAEKIAYLFYQITNALFFIYSFFVKVKTSSYWFYAGLVLYIIGLLLCLGSVYSFASPTENGLLCKGLYRFSRNPMYVAYFVCFLGCALLTQSLVLLVLLLIFQVAAHWIILAEERWCKNEFGEEYISYMKKVRRYL